VAANKLVALNITDMITHDENELAEFLEPLDETENIRGVLDKELQEVMDNIHKLFFGLYIMS